MLERGVRLAKTSMMLRVLGRPSSSNTQKVIWLLAELGVQFTREDYGGKFGRLSTPEYLALNPNGVIPTLIEADFVLWESNSICRYLANRHGATSLYPSAPRDRALCERWMDWQLSTLSPGLAPLYIALIRKPSGEQPAALRDRARNALSILDAALAGQRFLQGDHLTLADICNGIWTHRWFALQGNDGGLENLSAWYARLSERVAYRHNVIEVPLE
jgi:glutathione S-transferase